MDDDSLLNRLPAELRNRIYEHVMVEKENIPIIIRNIGGSQGVKRRSLLSDPISDEPLSLLRTSKHVHAECQPLFYGSNTFELHALSSTAPRALENFLLNTTTQRNLSLLRTVKVNVGELRIAQLDVLEELLDAAKAQQIHVPQCHISTVFMSKYCFAEPPLRLELDPSSRARMEQTTANCLAMVDDAKAGCPRESPLPPWPYFRLEKTAHEILHLLRWTLEEVLASLNG